MPPQDHGDPGRQRQSHTARLIGVRSDVRGPRGGPEARAGLLDHRATWCFQPLSAGTCRQRFVQWRCEGQGKCRFEGIIQAMVAGIRGTNYGLAGLCFCAAHARPAPSHTARVRLASRAGALPAPPAAHRNYHRGEAQSSSWPRAATDTDDRCAACHYLGAINASTPNGHAVKGHDTGTPACHRCSL